ncbi:hypothetical protein CK203_017270 [Vitis vinifera]|uniref:DUF4283 domain-containing protein n=1 Tax=Vitis vinifera TaxID=29760 RepID=A0A438JZE0_VITVI|nr:hypothetical protein CK203_017270 [Vitis vinifera]
MTLLKSKEGESRAENRGRRKGNRVVVESKLFEVETEERNGKRHVVISESKGELVSWVRLGPASVGLVLEGLSQCLRNGEEGRWEKGWKEKGRFYSMRGKEKGGWLAVKEALRREGCWLDEKESDQGVRESGKLYAEVVKGLELRDTTRFRVEIKEEETKNNVSRLRQCLIGKWSPSSAREEDLACLGWAAARAWGLRGKLGLARLGKGCALLEFEKAEEAEKVLASGERLVGGIQMGLEVWSPKFGCAPEGENRKEAWVRIVGLPISLGRRTWNGQDQSKAAGRGIAEFDGDRGGGGGVRCDAVVGDLAGDKEEKRGMAETAVGDREGRLEVRKNHARRVACGRKSERCTQGTAPVRRWDGKAEGQKWDYGQITQGGPVNKKVEWAAMGKEGGGWPGPNEGPKEGMDYGDGLGLKLEEEFIKCREKEANGMQQQALQCSVAERAIMDEALRESCDHSGEIRAGLQKESKMEPAALGGPSVSREDCWDLIEINSDALEVQNPECTPVLMGSPRLKGARRRLNGRIAAWLNLASFWDFQ